MKTRILASLMLIAVLLGGCAKNVEVKPGIYMSNDPADFPFPTSGYTVYLVGESHGNREAKTIFQAYLKKLYQEAGLRDVILEEDQAYETEANAYVRGTNAELPQGLCLRADILGQIRDFNLNLPDNEKVTVHLVDVDSPLRIVYDHLIDLHSRLDPTGESVQIPEFAEFEKQGPKPLYDLIDELRDIAVDQPDVLNGLDTVHSSLLWYFKGNRVDTGWPVGLRKNFAPIREDVITRNVEYVLSQLNGRPVLAFFGAAHGMKVMADPNPPVEGFKSWAQRLVEKNVSVYSTAIFGVSGESFWRGQSLINDSEFLKDFKLADGTTTISLFDIHPDSNITYIDLRTKGNTTIRLSPNLLDVPASQYYDGVIIFKEFTPMEDKCPK